MYDKSKIEREQWSCEFCKKRKLVRKRNCGNNYPTEDFRVRIPVLGILTECPISAIDKLSYNLYSIVKECNAIGMGGGLLRPSLFYAESNMYFEARNVVLSMVSEFDELREKRTKKSR